MAIYPPNTHTVTLKGSSIHNPPYAQTTSDYSIASIQVGGEAIPFMVSASPAILQHALTQMKETGYLYLYNGTESLAIRADKVDAVKLTRMTTTGV
jgi:hypothetical protein